MGRIRNALGLERRSYENPARPLTAKNLSEWLGGSVETDAGIRVSEQTALTFGAVFACVQILARGVGMLPLRWYERGSDGSRREATDQLASQLLTARPNREHTPVVFLETLQGHNGLGGNGYARILHDGAGRPRELYPLNPGATSAERMLQTWDLRYLTTWKDRAGVVLEPEEVLHVPGLGFDGVTGYSPVGMARQAIGLGLAAEQFAAKLFHNGAWLSGVFQHPGELGETAHKNLAKSLRSKSGTANAFQPLILEEGMEWNQATMPSEDATFLALRKMQRREVAAMYQVPPHMIADLEGGASFSSIEQMSLDFVVFTLGVWLVKWEQECTRKLGDGRRYYAEFDTSSLLRAEVEKLGKYYTEARNAGWLSVNEIRRRQNLPPIEGGDTYLQPLNMAAAGKSAREPARDPEGRAVGAAPGNVREALAQAHRQLLVDTCARMVKLEADRAQRAARAGRTSSPDAFRSWAEAFYREQVDRGLAALQAPARVVAVASSAGAEPRQLDTTVAEALVAHLQLKGRERAAELAGAHEAGRLDELLQAWQVVRPEHMADEVLRAIVGAVQPLAA